MPDWRSEYLESIKAAEAANPVNAVLVETCSSLQDRVAHLEAQLAAANVPTTSTPSSPHPTSTPDPVDSSSSAPHTAKLRVDLAEALRSRGTFEARLRSADDELATLRARSAKDAATLVTLKKDKERAERKAKDRDEEMRGKRKHFEDIQDENITLTLQLNMTEKERDTVKSENKRLVEELMRYKGKEAEKLNEAMNGVTIRKGSSSGR